MSIINDALKKTQNSLQNSGQKNLTDIYQRLNQNKDKAPHESLGSTSPVKGPNIKSHRKWFHSILSFICISLLVGGALFAVLMYLIHNSSSITLKSIVSSFQFHQEKMTAAPSQRDPNAVKLDGVVTTGEKRAALINGEVYEVGDVVNGRKIVGITDNRVDLLYQGGMETLKVR